MADLEVWLKRATRSLSDDAQAQVRREIAEHFWASREAAMQSGASDADAELTAMAALGDAGAANRQYRRVLLTKDEARMLRESAWESKWVCSRGWIRWFAGITALASLVAGVRTLFTGPDLLARIFLMAALGIGLVAAPMFLPLFTPLRGRMYRFLKMALMAAILAFLLQNPHTSWLFVWIVWQMVWNEWRRMAIRRKIPQSEWPKHLYL